MKHGIFKYLIILGACLCVVFVSCSARKSVQRANVAQTTHHSVSAKKDSSRVVSKTVADLEETINVHETTERETIHLDSIGRVRTIVRESVRKEAGQRRHDRGSGSVVSVTGSAQNDSIITVSESKSQESVKQDMDSRLIQGSEWVWVILSIALIVSILVYVLVNRKS